jgi:cytochrome c5
MRLKVKIAILAVLVVLASALCAAESPAGKENAAVVLSTNTGNTDTLRIQGELRFRANCNRCHAAPSKFPHRMMATIVRHMRVRATITDEDMRLILFYMTQ